jgi:putative ABC transport system ATP-binding protein
MAAVLSPNSGGVTILGKKESELSIVEKDRLRGDFIGFVFQSFNLIPYLTIYENILLPLKSSQRRHSKVKNRINKEIQRISKHLNINELLHKRVTELSIGQQQRVAVARALIGDPEIIIADEPTSSLDEEVTDSFMQLLVDEHKKKKFTLIFVSHDRRLTKFFDREIALSDIHDGAFRDD